MHHTIQLPTRGKYCKRDFQTIEPLEDFVGSQNHSEIERVGKFLKFITLTQRVLHRVRFQRLLPAKAGEKSLMFFKPRPPNSLGATTEFQLTKGGPP